MSISTTLSNALSGLSAASRSAQVVSTNVANAMTEGYARREIELSARSTGGVGSGVQVDGVKRVVDEILLRDRRLASAALGETQQESTFYEAALKIIGEPHDPASLVARTAELDRALLAATSRPESDANLHDVLNAAKALANKLNDATDSIQTIRRDAENEISSAVRRLNQNLEQIAELNEQVLRARGTNQDYPSLLDQRQNLIDEISELIPIQQLNRDNGTVALYSTKGALLVDVTPSVFEFAQANFITADMTIASGSLSALSLNGERLNSAGEHSPIFGGKLFGHFKIRDETAPSLQSDLDAMAQDLISRFEDPSLDTTLSAGDPGIFTDKGSALDPTDVVGLAGRLRINSVVDPSVGGAVFRLRDGIGASSPGPIGDAQLLSAFYDRLIETRPTIGSTLATKDRSVTNWSSDISTQIALERDISEKRTIYHIARSASLNDAHLMQGVDTDHELQKLLLIEQAYAANARVIQSADELIQILIGL